MVARLSSVIDAAAPIQWQLQRRRHRAHWCRSAERCRDSTRLSRLGGTCRSGRQSRVWPRSADGAAAPARQLRRRPDAARRDRTAAQFNGYRGHLRQFTSDPQTEWTEIIGEESLREIHFRLLKKGARCSLSAQLTPALRYCSNDPALSRSWPCLSLRVLGCAHFVGVR